MRTLLKDIFFKFYMIFYVCLFALFIFLTACSSEPEPVDLSGTWETAPEADTQFSADIREGTIAVSVVEQDVSILFWKGTFAHALDGGIVISTADRQALNNSLLGSSLETKDFLYEDNKLSFDFTVFGITQRIHLHKV